MRPGNIVTRAIERGSVDEARPAERDSRPSSREPSFSEQKPLVPGTTQHIVAWGYELSALFTFREMRLIVGLMR